VYNFNFVETRMESSPRRNDSTIILENVSTIDPIPAISSEQQTAVLRLETLFKKFASDPQSSIFSQKSGSFNVIPAETVSENYRSRTFYSRY
jgi:hypothetical protein